MLEGDINLRVLKTSALLAALGTLLLFCALRSSWAWGFLIGSALSLFSFASLMIIVPRGIQPGATRRARRRLMLALALKLPFYGAGLYALTQIHGVEPMAAMFGIALTPIVITLKTIGSMMTHGIKTPC
ncbi:MAG TPA: ATP synthase subunit I [Chthonomonadaceae bacterium]|nr:ATP synthase subunit I [Chthonomonadaceae bacterium]